MGRQYICMGRLRTAIGRLITSLYIKPGSDTPKKQAFLKVGKACLCVREKCVHDVAILDMSEGCEKMFHTPAPQTKKHRITYTVLGCRYCRCLLAAKKIFSAVLDRTLNYHIHLCFAWQRLTLAFLPPIRPNGDRL